MMVDVFRSARRSDRRRQRRQSEQRRQRKSAYLRPFSALLCPTPPLSASSARDEFRYARTSGHHRHQLRRIDRRARGSDRSSRPTSARARRRGRARPTATTASRSPRLSATDERLPRQPVAVAARRRRSSHHEHIARIVAQSVSASCDEAGRDHAGARLQQRRREPAPLVGLARPRSPRARPRADARASARVRPRRKLGAERETVPWNVAPWPGPSLVALDGAAVQLDELPHERQARGPVRRDPRPRRGAP